MTFLDTLYICKCDMIIDQGKWVACGQNSILIFKYNQFVHFNWLQRYGKLKRDFSNTHSRHLGNLNFGDFVKIVRVTDFYTITTIQVSQVHQVSFGKKKNTLQFFDSSNIVRHMNLTFFSNLDLKINILSVIQLILTRTCFCC